MQNKRIIDVSNRFMPTVMDGLKASWKIQFSVEELSRNE